jgi:hypothetical protein
MITKKIGKVVFGWDPTAMNGKGYWYVWSPGDMLSRAASAEESQKLGKPKAKDMPKPGADKKNYYFDVSKQGKPVRKQRRTGSDYEDADITSQKGLMQLASERMMSGEGLGKSLRGAISDKMKATGTRLSKLKDPMNWLSKLPGVGQLAATAYGKKMGRSDEDISYYTGVRASPNVEMDEDSSEQEQTASKVNSSKGSKSGTLEKIYQLLVDKFSKDTSESLSEEEKAEEEVKRKELIDTLKELGDKDKENKDEKDEKQSGIFGAILSSLGSIFSGFIDKLSLLFGVLGKIGGAALSLGRGVFSAGKTVAKGAFNLAGKAASSIKSGVGSVISKGKDLMTPVAKTGLKTNKAALLQANPKALSKVADVATDATKTAGTVSKVVQTAEKTGSALAKTAGTASKVAKGAGSKLLKGGGKLLGFLKSIPGLSAITAGADLIMRVNEVNSQLETGEIKETEYRKEITKAVGDAAAAGLLPVLGGAIGSVIPGVGTLVGGLAGVGVSLLGGDKVGGWLAGKMYDYFVDGKTASDETSKPTATPMQQNPDIDPTEMEEFNSMNSDPNTKHYMSTSDGLVEMSPKMAKATPIGATPSPITTRAQSATSENLNLTGPTSTLKSEPVIINAPKQTVVNNSMGGGGGTPAKIRNDEPILTRLQYQNVRPV